MATPHAIAMSLANAIPGCRCQNAALEGGQVLKGILTGWGPSLHRMSLSWEVHPRALGNAGIADAMKPVLDLQRRRIAQAATLGLATDRQPDVRETGHLRTDRLLRAFEDGLHAETSRALERLSGLSKPAGKSFVKIGDITLHEGCDEDPRPMVLMESTIDHGAYDGRTLTVYREVPETVLAAIPGMRVRDVVDFGERLEHLEYELHPIMDRIIMSARADGDRIEIVTEPDWVAFNRFNEPKA